MTELRHDLATVTVARTYPVSPATLFAALSDPVAMAVWASPAPTFRVTVAPHDFREGGVAVITMDGGDGALWINEDRYQQILPDVRIIQTSSLRHKGQVLFAGVVVMTLMPEGAGTRLQVDEHGCFPDGRDAAAMHEAGWGQVLGQLGTWLAG